MYTTAQSVQEQEENKQSMVACLPVSFLLFSLPRSASGVSGLLPSLYGSFKQTNLTKPWLEPVRYPAAKLSVQDAVQLFPTLAQCK
jgi:hypothetical protein